MIKNLKKTTSVEFDVHFSGELANEFLAVLNTTDINSVCPELRKIFYTIYESCGGDVFNASNEAYYRILGSIHPVTKVRRFTHLKGFGDGTKEVQIENNKTYLVNQDGFKKEVHNEYLNLESCLSNVKNGIWREIVD